MSTTVNQNGIGAPKTPPDPGQAAYKKRTEIDEILATREEQNKLKEVWDE